MVIRRTDEWQLWEDQRYWFFGCFSGVLTWSCPYCGHVQQKRMRKRTWRLKCTECRRALIWCITLKRVDATRQVNVVPRDLEIGLAPVPVTQRMPDGARAPIHQQVSDVVEDASVTP